MSLEKTKGTIDKMIGRKIARAMEARGETRASLASAIGTTETRIARVIKGSSALTAAELLILSRALQVHPNHLLL